MTRPGREGQPPIDFAAQFAGIAAGLRAGPGEEVAVFHLAEAEFTGARGAFAERVAGWRREGGLMREIAVQGKYGTIARERRTPYKTAMIAMPLNEEQGQASQVLLLFPTEAGSFDYRIVMPQESRHPNPSQRRMENEDYVRGFDVMFGVRDNEEPFIHNGWQIAINSTPLRSFDANLSRFPVQLIQAVGPDKEELLEQAEQVARRLKAVRQAALQGSRVVEPE